MLISILLLALPHIPAAAAERPSLLVTDLSHSDDVKPDVARTLTELVTGEIARDETFRVMAGADIRNMVALEGERQAMGCESDQSCLAEVAGALGARFVVFGRVSTLDTLFVLQLNLMDAQSGVALARVVAQSQTVSQFAVDLALHARTLLSKAHDVLTKESAATADRANQTTQDAATTAATSTDVMVTPVPAAEAPADDDSFLPMALLIGGGGVTGVAIVGAITATIVAGASGALVYDTGYLPEVREDARTRMWVGAACAAASIVFVVGGLAMMGASFAVE